MPAAPPESARPWLKIAKVTVVLWIVLIAAFRRPREILAEEPNSVPETPADRSATPSKPGLPPPTRAQEPEYVPVASYTNRPDVVKKDGARAHLFLQQIEKLHTESVSPERITLSVPASDAAAARHILARAIMEEKLRLRLVEISPKTHRAINITPQSIIRAYARHGPDTIIIDDHFPAPNNRQSITYRIYDDAPGIDGDENSNEAVLFRGNTRVWTFTRPGRALCFSWSADSRYLLIALVRPGRDMNLYSLDSSRAHPKEHDLNLDAIEDRVESRLPRHQHSATSGCSAIDVDKIEWPSTARCRLHYRYAWDEKSGDAVLDLNLAARVPRLRILSITPTPE